MTIRRPRSIPRRVGYALVALALPLAAAPPAFAGKVAHKGSGATPVRTVDVSPQAVPAGRRLTAELGLRGKRPVRLAFYLATGRRPSRGAVVLGSRLVRPRRGKPTKVSLRVPRAAAPMAARLLVCVPPSRHGHTAACRAGPPQVAVIRRPAPLRVKPRTGGDPSAATIGAAGGSVAVSIGKGAVATLSVPAGALAADTEITLTPLASFGHAIPGRLLGAVAIGPPRLALAKPATLKVAGAGRAGIVFAPDGRNLHLVPLRGGGLQVGVLGGAGVVSAGKGALAAFANRHVAADATSQLEQLLAVSRGPARRRKPAPTRRRLRAEASVAHEPAAPSAELLAYLAAGAYEIEALAGADFMSALAHYEVWDTAFEALGGRGLPPSLGAEVRSALIAAGLGEVAGRDSSACEDHHDLSQGRHLLEIANAGSVLGAQPLTDAADAEIAHCFQFDLTLDSSVHYDNSADTSNDDFSDTGGYDWHYQAKVKLDYDPSQVPGGVGLPAKGSGDEAKFIRAEGAVTGNRPTLCDDHSGESTESRTLISGDGGIVTGSATVPLLDAELTPFSIAVTFSSTATETYRFTETGNCDLSYETPGVGLWWVNSVLGMANSGQVDPAADGSSLTATLEPPPAAGTPGYDPQPGLLAERVVPTAYPSSGVSGQTTIRFIHDPGHVLLSSLPPALN